MRNSRENVVLPVDGGEHFASTASFTRSATLVSSLKKFTPKTRSLVPTISTSSSLLASSVMAMPIIWGENNGLLQNQDGLIY